MTSRLKYIILSIIGVLIILLITLGILHAKNFSRLFQKPKEEVKLNFGIADNEIYFKVAENNEEDIIINIKPKVTFDNSLNLPMEVFYNLELNINENNFIYSDYENKTPEIILNVKDPTGKEIDKILGLNYNTTFDITGFFGPIKIFDQYLINYKNKPVSQTWDITITFKNLEVEQNENWEKEFKAIINVLDYKIKTD